MESDTYIALIYKKLKGEISNEEQLLLTEWLDNHNDNKSIEQEIRQQWELTDNYGSELVIDIKEDYKILQKRIQQQDSIPNHNPPESKKLKLIPIKRQWLTIAASLLVVIIAGFWYTSNQRSSPLIIAETISGAHKTIHLSDGTIISLNENSILTYPAVFESNNRTVTLNGEAFFEVAKDPNKIFSIKTSYAQVQVLGTSFNLKIDQKKKQTYVGVLTGKVSLQPNKNNNKIMLEAGEMGVYNASSDKLQKQLNWNKNDLSWKSGILKFNKISLINALADIESLFKIKVSIKDVTMNECKLSGRFDNGNAKEVLAYIADIFDMKLTSVSKKEFLLENGSCLD